jgi:hypothetical protein
MAIFSNPTLWLAPNNFLFTASVFEGLSHWIGGIKPHRNGPHNAANN